MHTNTTQIITARLLHTQAAIPAALLARRSNKPKTRRRLWNWLANVPDKNKTK